MRELRISIAVLKQNQRIEIYTVFGIQELRAYILALILTGLDISTAVCLNRILSKRSKIRHQNCAQTNVWGLIGVKVFLTLRKELIIVIKTATFITYQDVKTATVSKSPLKLIYITL